MAAKNIKNYTSETAASLSIQRIEDMIIGAGARQIAKSYDANGQMTGLKFLLPVNNMQLTFDINAKAELVYKKMIGNYVKTPTAAQEEVVRKQAGRTAWKNMQELLQIQLDMVELDQVEMMQALFLSLTDGQETVYEKMKKTNFKALLPASITL
jgi:hypothetical protein